MGKRDPKQGRGTEGENSMPLVTGEFIGTCAICGTPTRQIDVDYLVYVCSEACVKEQHKIPLNRTFWSQVTRFND